MSEWLAFDAQHPVARDIAQKKWRRLAPFGQIPSSTNEAVAESHRLEMPSAVLTRPSEQSPAWLEIVSVSMEEKAV